tara:strand:+ start:34 stop:291 length:258 start_codon:yes stop_codon:yes gene_type:complete
MEEKTKPYDDSNWREEQKPYVTSKLQLEVLEQGPRSLAQSWMMQAMKNQWKKRNGYKDPEPPDCQSSLKESLKIFDDYSDPYGGH